MNCLVVQTAFIGDVVLATSVLESIHTANPQARIDILVKKGYEALLDGHPFVGRVLVFDKKASRFSELLRLIKDVRLARYDLVVNLHRFSSSGVLTALSGASRKVGFKKNPLSIFFDEAMDHSIDVASGIHEIERNFALIEQLPNVSPVGPRLYPSESDRASAPSDHPYICIAPASVWYTKQWPIERWVSLIHRLPADHTIYLLGGPADQSLCDEIRVQCREQSVVNKAGQLSFLASCAWMQSAKMNYVNDSAPLHFASAVDAPVTAIFCSTVPGFGFGPLSTRSTIWQTHHQLACRPCGLHGKRSCPEGHFRCAEMELPIESDE